MDLLHAFKCHRDGQGKVNTSHMDGSRCFPLPTSFDEQPLVSEDRDNFKLED